MHVYHLFVLLKYVKKYSLVCKEACFAFPVSGMPVKGSRTWEVWLVLSWKTCFNCKDGDEINYKSSSVKFRFIFY